MSTAATKPEPKRWTQAELLAYTERAIRDGRHNSKLQTVCSGCYEWVDSIMHVTIDKKRLCPVCYVAMLNPSLGRVACAIVAAGIMKE